MFIPNGQNISCRRCGACCRGLFVPVSSQEKENIARLTGRGDIFLLLRGKFYMARKKDGSCVLLDDDQRCTLHKTHGLECKPLACRAYPLAFSLRGEDVAAGVRFDCPAIASNEGQPLSSIKQELLSLSEEIREATSGLSPGSVHPWRGMSWDSMIKLVSFLAESVSDSHVPLDFRPLILLRLLEVSKTENQENVTNKDTLKKLTSLRTTFMEGEKRRAMVTKQAPSRFERSRFDYLLMQYARRDAERPSDMGWPARIRRALAATRVLRRREILSVLGSGLPEISLSGLDDPLKPGQLGQLEPIERFFRVKLESHQFYGPSHHGFEFEEGLASLVMTYPILTGLSRLYAHARQGSSVSIEDATRSVMVVDHNFSQLQALAFRKSRKNTWNLTEQHPFRRLCQAYGVSGGGGLGGRT